MSFTPPDSIRRNNEALAREGIDTNYIQILVNDQSSVTMRYKPVRALTQNESADRNVNGVDVTMRY